MMDKINRNRSTWPCVFCPCRTHANLRAGRRRRWAGGASRSAVEMAIFCVYSIVNEGTGRGVPIQDLVSHTALSQSLQAAALSTRTCCTTRYTVRSQP
ncbi:unnamed protein product, partial [Iphiclides podalirius]